MKKHSRREPIFPSSGIFPPRKTRWITKSESTACSTLLNASPFRPSPPSPEPAQGAATTIAACCDIRIAAANARFGVPIGRTLGNCLSMSNYARLVALLGPARVKEIIFTARLIDSAEARAIGLLSEVLPDYAALQIRADELARTVASQAPLTLRATKEALRRIKEKMTPDEDGNLILTCYMSSDFREGLDAFLNKRPPKWTGT